MSASSGADAAAKAEQRALLDGVSRALAVRDIPAARRLAERALGAGLEHAVLYNLRAIGHEEAGRLDEALSDLRKAHFLAPNDFTVLNALGLACARSGRLQEALACYERTLRIKDDFAPGWFNRGWALERLGEVGEAEKSHARAIELDSRHVDAWASAAWLAARRGDRLAATRSAERALALKPDCVLAHLALADVERTKPETAERRLRLLLERADLAPAERALALSELGDALDALGRPAEAFTAYSEGNALSRKAEQPRFAAPGQETAAEALGWMIRWAEGLDPATWMADLSDSRVRDGEREHVFLMGFPRSGTTLIESLLAGHPDVVSLEERGTLDGAVRAFLATPAGLDRLADASPHELQPHRDDYWRNVRRFGCEPEGKIFIDKNPFHTLRLQLIWKLFPQAKVIFAVRDPRDVVFSCFRRSFNFNPSTYQLLDLAGAARFYGAAMRFAELLRRKQGLSEHRLVYERLVEDFEGEALALCAFVGADWRDGLSDFADRARRGGVASASAAQIARGLYGDGVGQWRRYRAQLEPALAILKPWVERLGYPAD
jgi:tetratricopeptide (TPR) repeat protein